jgi:hypothetical protein
VVSKIGMTITDRGTINVNNRFVASCHVPITVTIDKVKPKNKLPQSPMKILAGLKLNFKKPSVDPAIIEEINATKGRLFWRAYMNIQLEETKEIPLESPSILSRILTALVIPTIQKTVKGMAIIGYEMILIFIPKKMTIIAKISSTMNLVYGFNSMRSSYSPKPNMAVEQIRKPIVNLLRGMKIRQEIMKDTKIPMPPNRAVGFLCQRSFLGSAIKPYRWENLMMRGTIDIDRKNERRKTIMYLSMNSSLKRKVVLCDFISMKLYDVF